MNSSRRGVLLSSAAAIFFAATPALAQAPAADDADVEVGTKPEPPRPAPLNPNPPPPTAPKPSGAAPPKHEVVAAEPLIPDEPAGNEARALRSELAAAETRIQKLEASQSETQSLMTRLLPPGLALSGYVQAQYESHQDSQDEVVGGTYLNQNRFDVRRGRIRFDGQWEYAELTIEPDFNTVNGPTVTMRRLEATLVYRNRPYDAVVIKHSPREEAPPLAALTLGVTDIPFGFEMLDSPRQRYFMERSQGSAAFFPSEGDVGARLWGAAGFFRYQLLLSNGEPLTSTASKLPGGDPTSSKDFTGRFGADVHPSEITRLMAGVSALRGKGFHAGTDATKNGLSWTDSNEDSTIQPNEITAVPGTAATASMPFDRWAVGGDLEFMLNTRLGQTMVYGEFAVASNLDRGLIVADPTVTGIDVREVSYYGAITQEITRYGVVGFRFDVYDPNSDFLDSRKGKLLPSSEKITTMSPMGGLILPDRARLLFQYDVVQDSLGRDSRGVPTDLANNRWTVRLQVEM